MDQVCIPIPMPAEGETLELEVTVSGTTHLMAYRIETVTWGPEGTPEERAEEIRTFLADYDPAWSLVQIGAPEEGKVPITFRRRRSEATAADSVQLLVDTDYAQLGVNRSHVILSINTPWQSSWQVSAPIPATLAPKSTKRSQSEAAAPASVRPSVIRSLVPLP